MPLSAPHARSAAITRAIICTAYRRDDMRWDIEGHLTDTRHHDLIAMGGYPIRAGDHVHDMWVRLTLSDEMVIEAVEAVMDAAPWTICPAALGPIDTLVGISIGRGFTKAVTEPIGGTLGCTHIREMLGRMANVAMQAAAAGSMTGFTDAGDLDRARAAAVRQLVGTCHSFESTREIIQQLAPDAFNGAPDPDENDRQRGLRLRSAMQPLTTED